MSSIRNGIIYSIIGSIAYTSAAGSLTSFSQISDQLTEVLNVNATKISLLNSVAFGLVVGLCPISTLCFQKFGLRLPIVIACVGFACCMILAGYSESYRVGTLMQLLAYHSIKYV